MTLDAWAERWSVSPAAVADLRLRLGIAVPPWEPEGLGKSEEWATSKILLDASQNNVVLTRNNRGVLKNDVGVPVRFGLFNETKERGKLMRSSDLIGIRKVFWCGRWFGVFTAREAKKPGWTYKGDEHEQGQLNFINFVNAMGGDAAFSTGAGSFI